jgi:hypothetical protein
MLEAMETLFNLARNFPSITGLKIHREPDVGRCSQFESIGLDVRTVKVEFVSYRFCGQPMSLVIVHSEARGSAVLMRNGNLQNANEACTLIAALVSTELREIVELSEGKVLDVGQQELEAGSAIRRINTRVNGPFGDDFVQRVTGGAYDTATSFILARGIPNE